MAQGHRGCAAQGGRAVKGRGHIAQGVCSSGGFGSSCAGGSLGLKGVRGWAERGQGG